jgi:enamine deaminase RidA (YjgF/YER057c/UK114 family)
MTSSPQARLDELGIELGPPIPPIGTYSAVVVHDRLAFTSGVVGLLAPDWELQYPGRFGVDLTPEQARASARAAMVSTLANLRGALGSLDGVARAVKVTGFVQTADAAPGLPGVLDGATELLADVFGVDSVPARSAVGVRALPGGASVELECVFALRGSAPAGAA